MPHPDTSAELLSSEHNPHQNRPALYVSPLGQTGLRATMEHRTIEGWVELVYNYAPAGNSLLIDEPTDEMGKKKRLNILSCDANTTDTDAIYWQLQACQGRHPTSEERLSMRLCHLVGQRLVSLETWAAPFYAEDGTLSENTAQLRDHFWRDLTPISDRSEE